jgi:transglutaminase-like putative cysteine protease
MKIQFHLIFWAVFTCSYAQNPTYSTLSIPDSLKQNANAVVRYSKIDISITSRNAMKTKVIRALTVLNELGLKELELSENYDKSTRVSRIEATVYDSFGKELKTYKKHDFKDVSVADGFSVFSDDRELYLDYTPTTYPFTMVFESEVETSNTVFIPSWTPFEGYLVSSEYSELVLNYKPELNLRKKEINFSSAFKIVKEETPSSIHYVVKNLTAKKREELNAGYNELFPYVYFAVEKFSYEGVEGSALNWNEFGKWYYQALLADTEEIPEETQQKIKKLVGNEKDPIEIARIIYKYVQEKTRYVSIQVGIGGWKPMLAKDVDKLGYGDCKALTNYTRSLLKLFNIPSYFTLVYAGNKIRNFTTDFAFSQGNHAILALPTTNEMLWLECTSQVQPFGFQGDFTDDRFTLVIKPEGGEIVKTKTFTDEDNITILNGTYHMDADGNIGGKIAITSKGLSYDNEFGKLRLSRENQVKKYKEEFNTINNLKINKITINDDPKKVVFEENLEFEAESYAQSTAGKLMFALNAFDQNSEVPKKYRTREFPFQIERSFTNQDEIEIVLPEGFKVEAKPNGIEQKNEFGYYKIEFLDLNNGKLKCLRKLVLNKGQFGKEKYEEYRKFRELIAKNDNSKVVLSKIQ